MDGKRASVGAGSLAANGHGTRVRRAIARQAAREEQAGKKQALLAGEIASRQLGATLLKRAMAPGTSFSSRCGWRTSRAIAQFGPCPVILDDVLMAFDDARAAAALGALAELSKRTQVLIFTHHAHHVELARRAGFQLHEIESAKAGVAYLAHAFQCHGAYLNCMASHARQPSEGCRAIFHTL